MSKKIRLYKNFIFILLLSFAFNNTFAQNESRDEFLGEQNFKVYSYRIAINHFKDAYEKDTLNTHLIIRLVECNYNLRRFKAADEWASRLIAIDSNSLNSTQLAYYIEILASNRKYDEASYWFTEYMKKDTTDEQQIERMRGFLSASDFLDVSEDYKILPVSFNSKQSDFGPSKFNDTTLVYTSARGANNWLKNIFKNDGIEFLGIYSVIRSEDGSFSNPEKFNGTIKSKYNEGPITFYDSTTKVIFSQNKIKARHWYGNRMAKSDDTTNNVQLYMADYIDGEIKNITDFPYNNKDYTSAHATVSDDGQILIYASNMPGGEGGSDLYICKRAGNVWSSPRNLGTSVNTEGNELFPYIYKDILYFSSDGLKGIGSLDIYKTVLIDYHAQNPVNLGYPFNSNADDFSFLRNEDKTGYFATNRSDEANDEIYFYHYDHQEPPVVNVLVLDTATNEFVSNPSISITIKDSVMLTLLPRSVSGDTMYTFAIDTTLEYDVLAQKSGYLVSEEIHLYQDTNVWIIPIARIDIGATITLKNIYYDFDKATLRDSSKFELNKLIVWLEDNPEVHIKLKSHTDSRGDDGYNLKLSERRAKSVMDYLIESGIDSLRLRSQGMGETDPIYSCPNPANCTKEQHQANRRTEFEVISVASDSTQTTDVEQMEPTDKDPFEKPEDIDKQTEVEGESDSVEEEKPE